MGQFRNKPLAVLDYIYGFLSGKTQVSSAQLETPLTLVHDVSREAELGGGIGQFGGYLLYQYYQSIGGANVYQYTSSDVYDSLSNATFLGPHNPQNYSVWYAGYSGVWVPAAGTGDVTATSINFCVPVASRMPFTETNPIYIPIFGTGSSQLPLTDQAGTGFVYSSVRSTDYGLQGKPLFLPRGTLASYYVGTGAAIASPGAVIWWLAWAGKKGTTPPGMG